MTAAGAMAPVVAQSAAAQPQDPKLAEAVAKANSEWLTAMKTGDAAVIAAPYAERGMFVFPDGSTIQGRDAVEKMYQTRFEQRGRAVSTSIDSKKLELDGDLAYEWGVATIGMMKDGKPVTAGGRYLTVWQKQASGEWQIFRNLVF